MSREEQQSADAPSARDVAAAREGGASTAPTERATIGGAVAGAIPVGGDLGRPSAASEAASDDPVFAAEQAHLSETYSKLEKIGRDALAAMETVAAQAAEDKKNMAEELAVNFATWDDILETHADIVAMNNIIEAHDMANSVQAERLRAVDVLLR